MRLPVDWRRPLPHTRDSFLGAGRPLPARARHLGLAQELGADATRRLTPMRRALPSTALSSRSGRLGLTLRTERATLRLISALSVAPRRETLKGEDMTPPGQYRRDERRGFVRATA